MDQPTAQMANDSDDGLKGWLKALISGGVLSFICAVMWDIYKWRRKKLPRQAGEVEMGSREMARQETTEHSG